MKNLASLFVVIALTGCVEPITLIVVPDAGMPDARPPVLPHCEIDDAPYVELGSPLSAVGLLPPLTQPVAIGGGFIAAASIDHVYTNASGAFEPLPSLGLPDDVRVEALAHAGGTWWIGTDGRPGPTIYRFDAESASWQARGRPFEGAVAQLFGSGARLVVHTQSDVFFLDDLGTSTYRALPRAEDEFVSDVVVSERGVYIALRGATTRIVFSADTLSFEDVPTDVPLEGAEDLAAGSGRVLAGPGIGFATGYHWLDESEAAPSLRFVPVTSDAPMPVWIGEDGTVLARSNFDHYVGDSLDGPFTSLLDVRPPFTSTGIGLIYYLTSDASAFVVPNAVSGGTLLSRSTDRGRSFSPAASVRTPATALELSSDGTTPMLRVRGESGEWRIYALRDGDVWEEATSALPHRSFAGVTGLPGMFVSRTTEYGDELPHRSLDGGRTWQPLDFYFPGYDTNAGSALRVVSSFAVDPLGRLLAGTVGGTTSICCTGSKIGWAYRSGAGVWRYTDGWTPVNAGIPIEYGPDPLGGPPFRSDIEGIVASDAGVFARLRGRGVYRLVADRWVADGRGLPLDSALTLLTFDDAMARPRVAAYGADALYVRETEDDGLWLPASASGTVIAMAARRDLLVASRSDGLFSSSDAGETWASLPPTDARAGHGAAVAFTEDRVYFVGEDHRVRALGVTCTEGE